MLRVWIGLIVISVSMLAMAPWAHAYEIEVWSQGFEGDTTGWFDNDDYAGYGEITAVSSGHDGVVSKSGSGHGLVGERYPFSRFDGYRDTWTGPFTASIDVYLDTDWAAGEGFDYSVAANGTDGGHQRDYIFHVTKDTSTGKLFVSGSNNTNFVPREDLENQNHHEVTSSGWYTFEHRFYENSGVLDVDLNLRDSGGSLLFTETRVGGTGGSDPDLIPSHVGGNRYAWFTAMNIGGGLAIDNHTLSVTQIVPEPAATILGLLALAGATMATHRRRRDG